MARVLLIENRDDIVQAVSDALRALSYSFDLAGDAAEALKLLQSSLYDIMIVEVDLPGKDGLALVSSLRRAGTAKLPPVIFVIGPGKLEPMTTAIAARAFNPAAVMMHPVDVEKLKTAIRGELST